MSKSIALIASGTLVSLFSLILVYKISSYAIKENNDAVFYFLFMPIIILIIGLMILKHGIRLKKNS